MKDMYRYKAEIELSSGHNVETMLYAESVGDLITTLTNYTYSDLCESNLDYWNNDLLKRNIIILNINITKLD